MKRILNAALVLVAAGFAYLHYRTTGPVQAYQTFAEEMLQRHYETAAQMSIGLSAADLQRLGSQERIGAGPAMFQTLFPSRFKIESEEPSADGATTIVARQTVLFNPAGVESARPAMFAELRQVASLRKTSSGWKISSFKNEFSKMDELARR